MTSEKVVEVGLAFVFVCPKCGRENFVRAVMHEFSPEEQTEMAEELGEKPKTGGWVTHPESVQCVQCSESFKAINPGELVDEKG